MHFLGEVNPTMHFFLMSGDIAYRAMRPHRKLSAIPRLVITFNRADLDTEKTVDRAAMIPDPTIHDMPYLRAVYSKQ